MLLYICRWPDSNRHGDYPLDFESSASANSATAAWCSVFTEHINHIIQICKLQEKFIFSLLLFYTSPLIMSKQSKVAK